MCLFEKPTPDYSVFVMMLSRGVYTLSQMTIFLLTLGRNVHLSLKLFKYFIVFNATQVSNLTCCKVPGLGLIGRWWAKGEVQKMGKKSVSEQMFPKRS